MVGDDFNVDSVWDDLSFSLEFVELLEGELGETEFSADSDLLSAWELEHGSSESLLGVLNIGSSSSDGNDDLTNVNSGGFTVWLSEGTSHTLLKSICSSA